MLLQNCGCHLVILLFMYIYGGGRVYMESKRVKYVSFKLLLIRKNLLKLKQVIEILMN